MHIFVSPRVRAVKTFEHLISASSAAMTGKITFTEDIAEWNYGDYEGLKDQEIRELRKTRGLDLEKKWNIWSDGCEGGEYFVPRMSSICSTVAYMLKVATGSYGATG